MKKQKTKHLSIAPSLIYFCFTGNISSRNLQTRHEYMIDDHFKNPDRYMYKCGNKGQKTNQSKAH